MRVLIPLVLAAALGAPLAAQQSLLHHRLHATVVVADPVSASDRIAAWAEANGGYFLVKSDQRVVIRLPAAALLPLRNLLSEVAEEVLEVEPSAVDLREQILGVRSGIRSRREILSRNLSFVDQADVAGTLAIEREITTLLGEIEGLEGRLRKLETDARYALAEIDLTFLEQSIPENIPSSFDWINTVDFYSFVKGAFE